MSFWTTNAHQAEIDAAENLAGAPSGGCIKMWLVGVVLALLPAGYGGRCLLTKHARFFGSDGSFLDLDGTAAVSLGFVYIAVGVFMHFHWFWGLHSRLLRFSPLLKGVSILVLLAALGYTIYRAMI